ncbi:MAG: DMT family transporter [Planctomycetota bacterium]|nr:DMT family transporter [Planctomycetota bacterium]
MAALSGLLAGTRDVTYNGRVNILLPPSPPRSSRLTPVVVGTACCLTAAILYTGANICLRALAGQMYQPWVICVKESVTVAAVGPWLIYQMLLGRRVWPTTGPLVVLVAVGLAVQLVGNLGLLWALEVIGLSVTIPAVIAVNLTVSAVLGWIVLREAVTRRAMAAIGILVVAIVLLHVGVGGSSPQTADVRQVALAAGAACLAGVTFAVLAVTIRKSVTGAIPPTTIIFVITGMGLVSLGPLSWWRLGCEGLWATPPRLLGLMLLAGLLNFAAFLAITKGFQYTSVVRANVLNTSQASLAAVTGLLFFLEPLTLAGLLGIGLTVIGTILVEPPRRTGRDG